MSDRDWKQALHQGDQVREDQKRKGEEDERQRCSQMVEAIYKQIQNNTAIERFRSVNLQKCELWSKASPSLARENVKIDQPRFGRVNVSWWSVRDKRLILEWKLGSLSCSTTSETC
jgi:hypothetical protein